MLMSAIVASEAKKLILQGQAEAGLVVEGHLDLAKTTLTTLPANLTVTSLSLAGNTHIRELPAGLKVRRLDLSDCTGLETLPAGLSCYDLNLSNTRLKHLPADLQVEYRLNLAENRFLRDLPGGLKTGSLILRNCTTLQKLPEGLSAYFLDISGCTNLSEWPAEGSVQVGRLRARGCTSLTELPPWLKALSQLDLQDCVSLTHVPESVQVTSWIDLAGTQIQALPASFDKIQLRWRGIPIDHRIAFQPEAITTAEVLGERNVEKRRVLLERMGYERFVAETGGKVINEDSDRGGVRQLIQVELDEDEPLVCVMVNCPSTAQRYILRVPPGMKSCHQAVAWIAGFDNPNDYHPVMET